MPADTPVPSYPSDDVLAFRAALARAKHILVLAGAGLSAASDVPTFRGDDGLRRKHDELSPSTPAAFASDPSRSPSQFHPLREIALKAGPNAAHTALARFAVPHFRRTVAPGSSFTIVTQNIDGLERRAVERVFSEFGLPSPLSPDVEPSLFQQDDPVLIEMHGLIAGVACTECACRHRELNADHKSAIDSSLELTPLHEHTPCPQDVPPAHDEHGVSQEASSTTLGNEGDAVNSEIAHALPLHADCMRTHSSAHDGADAVRILSQADFVILAGVDESDIEDDILRSIRMVAQRGDTIAFLGETADAGFSDANLRLKGCITELLPLALAIGENSRILDDGSVRTYYPGVTVTATLTGRAISYGDVFPDHENTLPLHSLKAAGARPLLMNARPPLSKKELMSLTDEAIVKLCHCSPSLTGTGLARELSLPPVHVLASNVVVKVGSCDFLQESEATAMALVRERTTIPVPAVHRFFQHEDAAYIVMEYVHGNTLDACWDDLSDWQKLRIAFTLRGYVQQMRRIRTPQIEQQVPGPITDDPSQPMICNTPALGEYPVGPFPSYRHLKDWMNGRYRVAEYLLRDRLGPPSFDDSEPLVFTHGDLCLRNIILGTDGRVWLIDFGSAGIYPKWFEAYGSRDSTLYKPPRLWTATRKIAIGDYDAQEVFDLTCQHAFSYGLGIPDPGEASDEGE